MEHSSIAALWRVFLAVPYSEMTLHRAEIEGRKVMKCPKCGYEIPKTASELFAQGATAEEIFDYMAEYHLQEEIDRLGKKLAVAERKLLREGRGKY